MKTDHQLDDNLVPKGYIRLSQPRAPTWLAQAAVIFVMLAVLAVFDRCDRLQLRVRGGYVPLRAPHRDRDVSFGGE